MTAQIKVKVQRKALVKLKVLPKFSSSVVAGDGIIVTRDHGSFTVALDASAGIFQLADSDLTAIAALSLTGFAVRNAVDSWVQRTLTAPAAGLTITNPAGIAGNPIFALANDLSALEALSGTGFAVRTGTDTWAQRTLTGTAAEITVTNGDGSGVPTFSLPTALTFTGKTVTGGTFAGPTFSGTITSGLASGIVASASGVLTPRTITGTAAEITVTNGTGASADPTLSLPAALTFTGKAITGGTFVSSTLSLPTITDTLTVSRTGNDVTTGAFLSTNLSNGSFNQIALGKAASSNNEVLIKYTQDASASTLGFQFFGDSSAALTLTKGGTASFLSGPTVGANAIYYATGTDVAIADGGTAASTAAAGFDNLSPTTTRGDLIVRGASNNIRKALGTSGYLLSSDGTDPQWIGFTQTGSGAVARTWQNKLSEYVSVTDFGAVGDDSTDDTTAFRNAIATGKPVFIPNPSVAYLISDELTCSTTGQVIFGRSKTKTKIHLKRSAPNAYNLSATGAPFKVTCGEPGPIFRNFLVFCDQPDTATRASLTAYPPTFYLQACPRFIIQDVRVVACRTCVDMKGNSGGASIIGLDTSALDIAIDIDGALDTVRIDRLHHWSFDLTTNQLTPFTDDTIVGIKSARCDDLKISNSLTICGRGMRFYSSGSGTTFGTITNHDFDGYGGLLVEAGQIAVHGSYLTLNTTAKRGVYHTGGNLTLSGNWFTVAASSGSNFPIIDSDTGTGPSILIASNNTITTSGVDVKHVHVNTTGTLDATFTGNYFQRDPNTAYTAPTIHVASGRATIIGNRTRDKGTGAGTFIQIDTDNEHRIGLNARMGWTNTFPTASSGIYDTTLVDTLQTQELANKTLNASVGKGTWTASGTWTLPPLTITAPLEVSQASDDQTSISLFAPSLSNGHFTQFAVGKAISSNNCGLIKFTQDASASTLSLQIFGDASAAVTITKGGLVSLPVGQLSFPATQNASADANTLDDYEEGTWTPTLNNFTVIGGTTLSGRYTKIGRLVFWSYAISAATSLACVQATSTITGLPFAAGANTVMSSAGSNVGANGLGTGYVTTTPTIFPPGWAASGETFIGSGVYSV